MQKENLTRIADLVLFFIALGAFILYTIDYGFFLSAQTRFVIHHIGYGTMILFIIDNAYALLYNGQIKREFLRRKTPYIITVLILLQFIFIKLGIYSISFPFINDYQGYVVMTQIYLFYMLLVKISKINYFFLPVIRIGPLQLFVLSFAFITIGGALLLMMPRATVGYQSMPFLDALFTSTSAVCVTGLTVTDTATYFTLLGKIIIILLIQIGGLGLMTFTSFFSIFFLKKLTIREQFMMGQVLSYESVGNISKLIRSIITLTFTIEFLGAAALYIRWHNEPGVHPFFDSVFHSISAFCNAGFSTFTTNLANYKGDLTVNLVVSLLIILGGLGFVVLVDLFRPRESQQRRMWSLQTKMVLAVSSILVIAGTVFIYIGEMNRSFKMLQPEEKILAAFFQSVSTRTAGFNTVDIGAFSFSVLIFVIILMYIGASPGSTGGGIKTTTAGLLYSAGISSLKQEQDIVFFKRTIPYTIVYRALALVMVSAVFLGIMFMILVNYDNKPAVKLLFELVSAFGTVGLSTGITSSLTVIGKVVIIITMFVGRLGPVTLALALSRSKSKPDIQYPEESGIMVG